MFIVTVNEELCKGCGLCAAACPKKIMRISDVTNTSGQYVAVCAAKEACVGCRSCAIICPDDAIRIEKEESF